MQRLTEGPHSYIKLIEERDGITIGMTLPFPGRLTYKETVEKYTEMYGTIQEGRAVIKDMQSWIYRVEEGDDGGRMEETEVHGEVDSRHSEESTGTVSGTGESRDTDAIQGTDGSGTASVTTSESANHSSAGDTDTTSDQAEGLSSDATSSDATSSESDSVEDTVAEDGGQVAGGTETPLVTTEQLEELASKVALNKFIEEEMANSPPSQEPKDYAHFRFNELTDAQWEDYVSAFTIELIGSKISDIKTEDERKYLVNVLSRHHLNR